LDGFRAVQRILRKVKIMDGLLYLGAMIAVAAVIAWAVGQERRGEAVAKANTAGARSLQKSVAGPGPMDKSRRRGF
jgi:hypothetical protein